MIGRLQGTLIDKQMPTLLLDVAGVGYEVDVPMSTFYRLPAAGEPCTLLTHMVVREDAQLLYGFADNEERRLFRTLIKISGVGARLGLAILSGMSVEDFVRTVQAEDSQVLTRLPGVGKKTAERLVIEMRDKLKNWGDSPAALPASGAVTVSVADQAVEITAASARTEAEHALQALGYKPLEVDRMLKKVQAEVDNVDALSSQDWIKRSLQLALKR